MTEKDLKLNFNHLKTIFVRTFEERIMVFFISSFITVKELKSKIEEMELHPIKTQYLIYQGKYLDDRQTLAFYNIQDKCFLDYHSQIGYPEIKIFIKNFMENPWQYIVTGNQTVDQLKASIEAADKIPVIQQNLIFGGQKLEDEKTLNDYNIFENCILTLACHSP